MVPIACARLCFVLRTVREKRQQHLPLLRHGLLLAAGVIVSVVMVLMSFFVGWLLLAGALALSTPSTRRLRRREISPQQDSYLAPRMG